MGGVLITLLATITFIVGSFTLIFSGSLYHDWVMSKKREDRPTPKPPEIALKAARLSIMLGLVLNVVTVLLLVSGG